MTEARPLAGGLKPLNMTCTSTDCGNGLHYFRPKPARGRKTQNVATQPVGAASAANMGPEAGAVQSGFVPPVPPRGPCRECGADLVDWKRVTCRDLSDAAHTFEELRKERIRHYFWHVEIDERAVRHARRKGRRGMNEAADRRIRSAVSQDSNFDGRQTPMEGNALYYAQHATAACCRKCIEEWHAIPRGRPLEDVEIGYLVDLVRLYVSDRLPGLMEEGERQVPGRREQPSYPRGTLL